MVGLPTNTPHHLQPIDVSFFGPLKTYYSQEWDNFMVTQSGQTKTDKNIGELLSIAYFKAATVGNAVKGFKECGFDPHNPLVFNEHDFAATNTTDNDVVGDETENNMLILRPW
ncbi:DDE-1 domain-containing protein [Trichonephila clavipes]|uniref:DDE-1 domain-containing protein n=1 Tax=Trichonephila clavipes TaxID=2585209 RepID=A0A8X6S968_TRICX|nr:DDE-1 domain-containing protein [Trichonephila clavipes]